MGILASCPFVINMGFNEEYISVWRVGQIRTSYTGFGFEYIDIKMYFQSLLAIFEKN
ncbi:hypothetical protein ABES11_08700 [Bacillus paranthracis]|uniref:hypothetical protein n=1 Tax=Bacillus paranthracis TaxID=2026186 RepID=UPI003D19CE85